MTTCCKCAFAMALFAMLTFCSYHSNGQISFAPIDTVRYYDGQHGVFNPTSISYQDYDHDGNIDVIFLREYEIVMKKGNGDGSFSDEIIMYTQIEPRLISISNFYDINDDGFLDLAISSLSLIRILHGSENGFNLVDETSFLGSGGNMQWMDYNKDNQIDLVIEEDNKIKINYNWSTDLETFEVLFENFEHLIDFQFVDIDLDEDYDLIISTDQNLKIFKKNDADAFEEIYKVESGYLDIVYGDINLNGFIDLIYSDDTEIYALLYDDLNNTYTQENLTDDKTHINITKPTLIDLDNNNSLDVVFGNLYGGLSYLKNTGGNFHPTVDLIESGIAYITKGIMSFDVNNDGNTDLFIHGSGNQEVYLLNGSIEIIDHKYGLLDPDTADLIYEDVDKDGFKDAIIISMYGKIIVRWGSNDNSFTELSEYNTTNYSETGFTFDLNNDDILDIFYFRKLPNGTSHILYVMYGEGNRNFSEPVQWKYFSGFTEAHIVDIDGDGENEILSIAEFGNKIAWLEPSNTNLEEYSTTNNIITPEMGSGIQGLATHDFNQDGFLDIVTANYETSNVSLFLSDGLGGFVESSIELNEHANAVQVFDYDGDGKSDLLVATMLNGIEKLLVYKGDDNGGFEFLISKSLNTYSSRHIDILDIEGDGDQDILVNGFDYSTFNLFENVSGEFQPNNDHGISSIGQGYKVFSDLNNDNKIDALSSSFVYGNVFKQINNSVFEPSIELLSVTIDNLSYNSFDLLLNETNASGKLIVLSESNILSAKPIDQQFYVKNGKFGIGTEIGGGHVVYANSAGTASISDLVPNTKYYAYVFEYNENSPQKTFINYSEEYVSIEITTTSSIYLLQDLSQIEMEEDHNYSIDLDEFINNIGDNSYETSINNEEILLSIDGSTLTLEPNENYFGEGALTLSVTNQFETVVFEIDVNILSINDIPQILGVVQEVEVEEDNPVSISIDLFNTQDPDNIIPDDFTILLSEGENYTLEGLDVLPSQDYFGTITVPVKINDGENDSELFQLSINVLAVNDAPKVQRLLNELRTNEDTPLSIVIENFEIEDVDNSNPDDFNLILIDGDNYSIDGNSLIPDENYSGALTVSTKVSDGSAESEHFLFLVIVNAVNDAPEIISQIQGLATLEEVSIVVGLDMLNINDPDNTFPDDFTLSVSQSDNYTLDGFTITPDLNFDGELIIPVSVSDGQEVSEEFSLVIDVTPVNDAPEITGQKEVLSLNLFSGGDASNRKFEVPISLLNVNDIDNREDEMTVIIMEGEGYSVENNKFFVTENADSEFTVTVKVNDGELDSESYDVNVQLQVIASLEDGLLKEAIEIWPNPASDYLKIRIHNNGLNRIDLSIFDVSGKVFFRKILERKSGTWENKISLSGIPKGMYVLQFTSEKGSTNKNILIER